MHVDKRGTSMLANSGCTCTASEGSRGHKGLAFCPDRKAAGMRVHMMGSQWTRVASFRGVRVGKDWGGMYFRSGLKKVGNSQHAAPMVCFSNRRDEDKSWGEIMEDTASVAKNIVGKVFRTGASAVGAVTGKKSEKTMKRQDEESILPPGGGLIGGVIGGMMESAIRTLGKQIRESQKSTQDMYARATDMVINSTKVQNSIGEITCQPPYSQTSSSQSVNGVLSKKTSVMFVADGERGTATVQAESIEQADGGGEQDLIVKVRLPNGQIVDLGSNSSGGGGRTIDAKWTDA